MRFPAVGHTAVKYTVGGFALASLVLTPEALAQAPAPFSQMPGDAKVVMRFNLDAMLNTPQLKSIRDAAPELQSHFTDMLHEEYGGKLFEDFPGNLSVIEVGITDPSAGNDDLEYLLMYGGMDRELIQQRIDLNETGELQTALTEGGVAASSDAADLAKLTTTGASASSGPLAGLIGAQGGSPVFVAASLTDENRAQLKAAAAQMGQQAAMFPGAPAFLQELGSLESAAFSVGESDAVNVNLQLSFLDEETTGRAVTALNQVLPGAAAMMQMMAQDPDSQKMAQTLGGLQFAQAGKAAWVSIPIPASAISSAIEQIEAANAMKSAMEAAPAAPAAPAVQKTAPSDQNSLLIPANSRRPFPGVQTTDVNGNRFDLAGQKGNVVLVDYWATWCGPCVREVPTLVGLHRQYDDKGLNIVSISLDRQKNALTSFTEKHGMDWTHIFDAEGELADMMDVQSIPTMYVLDRNGRIAAEKVRGQQIELAVMAALSE